MKLQSEEQRGREMGYGFDCKVAIRTQTTLKEETKRREALESIHYWRTTVVRELLQQFAATGPGRVTGLRASAKQPEVAGATGTVLMVYLMELSDQI